MGPMGEQVGRARRIAIVFAAIAVACLIATPALGQRGRDRDRFDSRALRRPEYSTSHLATIARVLDLDEGQRILAEVLLEEYSQGYNSLREDAEAEIDRMREQFQLAREANRPIDRDAFTREVRAQIEEYQREHQQLAQRFIRDVQATLTREQVERWPALERTLRRQELLPRGELSGERVDLFAVVERVQLSDETRSAIEPILTEYAEQLDLALRRREGELDEDLDDAMRDVIRAYFSGEADAADMRDVAKKQRTYRVRVRDINLRYADQILAEVVDAEEAIAFESAFKEAAFSDIYRESYGRLTLEAALDLPGLDERIRESIENLADIFEVRIAQLNQRLERITLLEEPAREERRIERILTRGFEWRRRGDDRDDDDDDPLRAAFEEREEFEAGIVLQVHRLLTEEQVRELPRRPDRGRRWRD